MRSLGEGGRHQRGWEASSCIRERTGRGLALEVETATSGRLRKSGNKYQHLCPEVKEPKPQKGAGLWD